MVTDGKKNWKTTVMGIAALLVAVGMAVTAVLDSDPATTIDISSIAAALAGLGLIAAKDGSN